MKTLPVLPPEAERARRFALRRPVDRDFSRPLTDLVAAALAAGPQPKDGARPVAGLRAAVVTDDSSVSYAGLLRWADQIAAGLRVAGCGPDRVVAVVGPRGADVVAAFLAIEQVGAVYLPLDARWPGRRLHGVLRDSAAAVLLVAGGADADAARAAAADLGVPVLGLPVPVAVDEFEVDALPRSSAGVADPDQPRYVLYTSGSTGLPKGALVEHRGLVNHLYAKVDDLGLDADDEVAFTAPLTFDISIWQMLSPLLAGGRVRVVGAAATDPQRLAALVAHGGLTVLELVPTMLRLLLDELSRLPVAARAPQLRWLLATGEELPPALAGRCLELLPGVRLLNAYGPTECSDDVTHHVVTDADLASTHLPIGVPVGNAVLYVLAEEPDGQWRACAPGECGELFVGGVPVGPGYLADPGRTAEVFFADPFDPGSPTGRLYRTGDAVRLTERGVLEYRGRVDRQVKIAGIRMELGEVEAVLRSHPAVRDCAVTVTTRRQAAALVTRETAYQADPVPELVAYYMAEVEPNDLAGYLGDRLPAAMVPRRWVPLPALPLSPNGKVDYRALPAPVSGPIGPPRRYEIPRDDAERAVASAFAGTLQATEVGRDDEFDALGGDSLHAMRVAAELRAAGYAVTVADILLGRTVAGVAGRLSRSAPVADGDAYADAGLPLTPEQRGVYFHWRLEPDSPYYSYQGVLTITGPLDWSRLTTAWQALLVENPNLTARIVAVDGQPVQWLSAWDIPLAEPVDLGMHPAAVREKVLRELAAAGVVRPFDLAREPVLRVGGYRMSDGDHRLLVSMHEILLDGWGATALFTRLAELYASGATEADPRRAERFQRFLARRLARLRTPEAGRAERYWRDQLAGHLPVLDLPSRPHARTGVRTYRGRLVERVYDMRRVRRVRRRTACTEFMVLLAGYALALGYYCDTDEVIVGAPIANRGDPEAIDVPTFALNMLPLRIAMSAGRTVDEHLAEVRSTVLDAYAAADHPFSEMAQAARGARSTAHTPVFATMFNMLTYPAQRITLDGLTFEFTELDTGFTKYDCALYAQSHGPDAVLLQLAYQTDVLSADLAGGLLASTVAAIDALCGDPGLALNDVDLLPEEQRTVLDQFNRED